MVTATLVQVRDMIVTQLRSGNASEKELEALALYMYGALSVPSGAQRYSKYIPSCALAPGGK